jgi:SulP family sulfate permease
MHFSQAATAWVHQWRAEAIVAKSASDMKPWFSTVRHDVMGGFVSASVAIPLSLGYGMFAFVALGDGYFTYGVVAGLLSALVVGLVAVALKDRSLTIYAPRIVSTFFIGALLRSLVNSDAPFLQGASGEFKVVILLLIVALAGFFQFLFGLVRMGSVLKHTPYPVLAGFQNAAAILLFLVQVSNVLGYENLTPITHLLDNLPNLKPMSLLVGAVTIFATWNAKRILSKVPPVITGVAIGTAAYYLLIAVGLGAHLGAVIGPGAFFSFGIFPLPEFVKLAAHPEALSLLPTLVAGALGLAFVASLDALMCAKILEGAGTRPDSNRRLMRLGLGNMLAGSMGGITGGINLGPSILNRAYGAKTPLSVVVNSSVVLFTLCVLLPWVGLLPRAALSGAIMVIAYQHLDASTVQMVRKLVAGRLRNQHQMALDLAVIVTVALLAIVTSIVTAVFIGVLVAMVLFLLRMSRSVVRASYGCAHVRSRKRRDAAQENMLALKAASIRVLVLEGALFFGTAERLIDYIEALVRDGAQTIILDLRHITDIDSTGARLLYEAFVVLKGKGVPLLLCHMNAKSQGSQRLDEVGLLTALTRGQIFQDTDRAIEWAEDRLILAAGEHNSDQKHPLEHQALFMGMSVHDRDLATQFFSPRSFQKGETLFRQGDAGEEMFVIVQGTASVHLANQSGGTTRLVTFSAGTMFGELAILDHQPRSATVTAEESLECYSLSNAAFASLKEKSPTVAIQLAINLGRELGVHLRSANQTIYHLAT